MDILQWIQKTVPKMIKGLKHLRRYSLASRKEGLGGSFINVYKYVVGGYKEDKASLFWILRSGWTRGNGHNLKYRKLHLNIIKNNVFYWVQCQALEQISHGYCGVSIFGNIKIPIGQGSGQPDFAVSKGLIGIDDSQINSAIKPWILEVLHLLFQCSPIKLILQYDVSMKSNVDLLYSVKQDDSRGGQAGTPPVFYLSLNAISILL